MPIKIPSTVTHNVKPKKEKINPIKIVKNLPQIDNKNVAIENVNLNGKHNNFNINSPIL